MMQQSDIQVGKYITINRDIKLKSSYGSWEDSRDDICDLCKIPKRIYLAQIKEIDSSGVKVLVETHF